MFSTPVLKSMAQQAMRRGHIVTAVPAPSKCWLDDRLSGCPVSDTNVLDQKPQGACERFLWENVQR